MIRRLPPSRNTHARHPPGAAAAADAGNGPVHDCARFTFRALGAPAPSRERGCNAAVHEIVCLRIAGSRPVRLNGARFEMLSFSEEVMLLMLEDENGRFAHVPELSMRCVLSGAVMMELALQDRIDTDTEKLVVVDPTPTGDDLLDPTLKHIVESEETHDARYWVEFIAREADAIRTASLDRLIEKGILRREDDRFLWVFRSRRYPMIDGKLEREAKLRIVGILFSEEIPGPRDIVMISLVDACGLFKHILSEREHKRARDRIRQVRKMDLIGQAVTNAVREIEASLALAMHPPF